MMATEITDLYQDTILRHSRAPLHAEALDPFDAEAAGDNPMCGDRCTIRLQFGADGSVARAGFQARGCAISLASADMMADVIRGRAPADIRALAAAFNTLVRTGHGAASVAPLQALSGVAEYPSRIKCATLPWAALISALDGAGEASSE